VFLNGGTCANGTQPLQLSFTTLGSLLTGNVTAGLQAYTGNFGVAFTTLGSLFAGAAAQPAAQPATVQWTTLGQAMGLTG